MLLRQVGNHLGFNDVDDDDGDGDDDAKVLHGEVSNHPCLLGKARLHDRHSGKSCATPAVPLIIDG